MPMPKGGVLRALAVREIRRGRTNIEVTKLTGVHRATVRKLRRELEEERGESFKCGCGRPVDHKGWCEVRFLRHPRRRRHLFYGVRLDDLRYREQTYKCEEAARRAFYKWICKQELYGNLIKVDEFRGRPYYIRDREKYNFGGIGFRNGYPSWRATRSEAKMQWQREFDAHRDELDRKIQQRRQADLGALDRLELLRNDRTIHFFKLLSVGGALAAR
jgi:hypothetical protein